jgi:hypothetical protein
VGFDAVQVGLEGVSLVLHEHEGGGEDVVHVGDGEGGVVEDDEEEAPA